MVAGAAAGRVRVGVEVGVGVGVAIISPVHEAPVGISRVLPGVA
ncbi:hypothetical protein HMPREF9278_0948 [Mobiluncus mulieris FB024-16]|nr:hypothetical protein HMPREF9278_0948 [Mobiluncus mulieris FB024-16]